MRKIISGLLGLIFVAATVIFVILMKDELTKEASIRQMEAELDSYFEPPESETLWEGVEEKSKESWFDWDAVLRDGEQVVAWIQMEGNERVDYPIVQAEDNTWYLNHDWKGQKQFAGSIFLNKNNAPDFTDFNSVIYGHRMKNRSMFGSFKYYTEQTYLDEHPYFYIYTPDGKKRTYEIFACANILDGTATYDITYEDKEDRLAYYNTLYQKAIAKRTIDISEFDTTVTLSTCAARGYYNRIVICGKLIAVEQNQVPVRYE